MKKIFLAAFLSLIIYSDIFPQWTQQSSGITQDLSSIFFTDENTGWACGWSGKIIKTTNGGSNWIEQSSGLTNQLWSLFFINSSTGWCSGDGGKILKTINGGTTWNTLTTGSNKTMASIYFIDANTGWACGDQGAILKTTDGGTSWNSQSSGLSMYDMLWSVKFVNSTRGWAVGGSFMNMTCAILKTTNGGTNWIKQNVPVSTWVRTSSFLNENVGYAVGDFGLILKTSNGGSNWNISPSPTSEWLYSVYFINETTGWIGAGNGSIFKTTDGGVTWAEQTTGISNRINSLFFLTANLGWGSADAGKIIKHFVVPSSISLVSPNGGELFQVKNNLTISWTSTNVTNVKIEYSTDNGTDWRLISSSYPASSGSYSWNISNFSSGNYLIKLSDVSNNNLFDVSDNQFEIYKPVYGDVDQNQIVQAYDASLILKHLTGSLSLTKKQLFNSDVSLDGTTSTIDAVKILQYVIQVIDSLPNSVPLLARGKVGMKYYKINDGGMIEIPFELTDVNDIYGFEGKLLYDSTVLKFEGITFSEEVNTYLSESKVKNGEINIVGAACTPKITNGVFIKVRLSLKENCSVQQTLVRLSKLRLNENINLYNLDSAVISIVTELENGNQVPKEFQLNQNYPNPFNPSTVISWQLTVGGFVTLKVYDVLGNEAATLVNEYQSAGTHEVVFQSVVCSQQLASGVSAVGGYTSGVYFYQLRSSFGGESFVQTKKMSLIK